MSSHMDCGQRVNVRWNSSMARNEVNGESQSVGITSQASSASRSQAAGPLRKVIVSGIQPTGIPHLGNMLGALFNWVNLQNNSDPSTELYFFIASLHAWTMPQDRKQLLSEQRNIVAALLAIGLNPNRCCIFNQAHIDTHPKMFWLLSCLTSVGRLKRMTAWKSKAISSSGTTSEDESSLEGEMSSSLLMYPVLQAADILLYRATHVPVGSDQLQHLELTRSIAEKSNALIKKSNQKFPLPEPLITSSPKIYSLRKPNSKMSKSDSDPKSRILLTDTDAEIKNKIKSAITDSIKNISFDPLERPGVSNLLIICAALRNWQQASSASTQIEPQQVAEEMNRDTGGNGGSSALKEYTTRLLVDVLTPIREKYLQIQQDRTIVDQVLEQGKARATRVSQRNFTILEDAMGLKS
ncbi:unnamed protein product [Sympodiomycopsis kandeliae]